MNDQKQLSKISDFRNFVYLTWKHLKLPSPTKVQYDIADYLANGDKRCIVCGFRGVGKSFITAAYVLWRLLLNPQLNILVISASKTRADDFSTFCLRLLSEMPILQHLYPNENQRQSKISFDVALAKASQQPSVKSLGITSQITGARADICVLDDVETFGNTQTDMMRIKLSEAVKEVEAVLKPTDEARVIFLGTPQSENSIYHKLQERGYKIRYWPSRYPSEKQLVTYGKSLAPIISNTWSEELIGEPTDPDRFSDEDLLQREASYGKISFNMQFQLDCTLSDIDRYPLKLSDLVVMNCNPDNAPEKIIWASSPELRHNDIPFVGLQGDGYFSPMQTQGQWLPYTGAIMTIDPAGKSGKDESAYCVTKILNGNIYVLAVGGFNAGYTDYVLDKLVGIAKKHKVNKILIEENFGQGMFEALLKPYLIKNYPCTTELVRATQNKHKRIIDTLEPLLAQHRIIIDKKVIMEDFNDTNNIYPSDKALNYQLFYQISRFEKLNLTIPHDDRIDCLQMACAYWIEHLAIDDEIASKRRKNENLLAEFERYWGMPSSASWIKI